MLSPLHDLFRYHPAYRFGRLDLSRDRVRPGSPLEEFEELERRKPHIDELEQQWARLERPASLVGDLAAMLLIFLALWGVASLFHEGSPQQREQMATEVATPG
jgi:hypothetical protein